LNQVHKIGLIVILVPAISVIAVSILVEMLPHGGGHASLWHRMAPFAVDWGIGLALVGGSLIFLKWAAGRDHDKRR